jgi:hypothetical protein
MHQHQLLNFATIFGFLNPIKSSESPTRILIIEEYGEDYIFISPVKSMRKLINVQFAQLQHHYWTIYLSHDQNQEAKYIFECELQNMDRDIKVWHRCRINKTIFHCAEYQRANSIRLNHLAYLEQTIDANANFNYQIRDEHMVSLEFYAYIQFFCSHEFRRTTQMLGYSAYLKTRLHCELALMKDLGYHIYGFHDVRILQHLYARVEGHGGRAYIVDSPEMMKERLRDALLEWYDSRAIYRRRIKKAHF